MPAPPSKCPKLGLEHEIITWGDTTHSGEVICLEIWYTFDILWFLWILDSIGLGSLLGHVVTLGPKYSVKMMQLDAIGILQDPDLKFIANAADVYIFQFHSYFGHLQPSPKNILTYPHIDCSLPKLSAGSLDSPSARAPERKNVRTCHDKKLRTFRTAETSMGSPKDVPVPWAS